MDKLFAQQLKTKARNLGFSRVGLISTTRSDVFGAGETGFLEEWLAAGHHADMHWMENNKTLRHNPAHDKLWPDTKSIVVVTMNYHSEDPYDANDPEALKIAKYARGNDYHQVIKQRLKQLLKWIQEEIPEAKGRVLTDSAPVLERALAVKAGLGWVGKNGCLIDPETGSFQFIGELLLNLDLEPDEAFATRHCGSCTKCIDACPTEAILPGSVVDANKCISYWTIESDAPAFPEAIRENLNGWVFGCDICQDVCPWNVKFARPTSDPDYLPRPEIVSLTPEGVAAMDPTTFEAVFANNPVTRTRLSGLKRNVNQAFP